MDNQQERLLDEDLNWLAGVWESEGWFSLIDTKRIIRGKEYRSYTPNCGISNTDPDFIAAVIKILERSNLAFHVSDRLPNGLGKKNKTEIQIIGIKRVERFLNLIFSYMRTKTIQAQIVLDFINYRLSMPRKTPYSERESEMWDSLRNSRLKVSSTTTRKDTGLQPCMI